MNLPDSQRFKEGSDRPYAGVVSDAAGVVDLTAMVGVIAKLRLQGDTPAQAVDLAVTGMTAQGEFEVNVSSLAVGYYYLELQFTDPGGDLHKPPEDLPTPGVPIEIYQGVA